MGSPQILPFYMGRNTPERKDYIIENLVGPVEERPRENIYRRVVDLETRRMHQSISKRRATDFTGWNFPARQVTSDVVWRID